jgi:TIR domain
MTGSDGGAGSDARPERRWHVALSFAGAEREYVEQVAAALQAQGVRCFYDADQQVRLWGTHLAEELPRIYARESAAVVVFVSADYAGREWTRLERRAAFSRAVAEAGVYVLPARFDDSELPGLLPDVVAVDLRSYTPPRFADLIVAKLADLGINPPLAPSRANGEPPTGLRLGDVGSPGLQADQWLNDLTDLNKARGLIDENLMIDLQRRILSRKFGGYYGDYGDAR